MTNLEKQSGYLHRTRETRSREKRREELERQFLEVFSHAVHRSRAYQEIYRSAGVDSSSIKGLEDLERLPILHMRDLVKRQEKEPPFGGFETIGPEEIRRIYINPGLILQPGERGYADTTWAEALCAAGFQEGDRIINTFNYHLWPLAFMLDESVGMLGATVVPTGVGNTMMQVKILQKLEINAFMGTPSFVMTLVQRAEAMGLDPGKDLALEKAVVGAEMLPESLRSHLEAKMEMTVRQIYGTVYLGCIGYECGHITGLHVPDGLIVEVVDPQTGKQVEDGTVGEVVATSFGHAYPMIRMATGDLSMVTKEDCPCGRTGLMLKRILGRIDQAAKVRGTFVHPWQADEVISRYPEVFKYQVVIERKNHHDVMTFVLELKHDIDRPEVLEARIERDIKEFLTVKGTARVVPTGTIPDYHKKIEDRRRWE